MNNTAILLVSILVVGTLFVSFNQNPKESFNNTFSNPLNAPDIISNNVGELVFPAAGGLLLNSNNKQSIRLTGTGNVNTNILSGSGTTANQIQFFTNGSNVSAFDVNGLYMVDTKSIYLGNATQYLQLSN